MIVNPDVHTAHGFSKNHRGAVCASSQCACFHCMAKFPPDEIKEWKDPNDKGEGQTALCPRCGVDAVLPGKDLDLSQHFLEGMRVAWFT